MFHLTLLPFAFCLLPFAFSSCAWDAILGAVGLQFGTAVQPSIFLVREEIVTGRGLGGA